MKNSVTNSDYDTAFASEDNLKMMQAATKKYRGILDREDLKSCKMIGLWKALGEFDENLGVKFTSFLYNVVRNECRKRLRQNAYQHKQVGLLPSGFQREERIQIEDFIEGLEHPLDQIIRLRYVQDMTLQEIGTAVGMSKNCVKRKIQAAIKQMKREWI